MSHLEATLRGSVKRIQLDNQMLDATQPVVLAPASVAHAHSQTAQSLIGGDADLVTFGITRSFANTMSGDRRADPAPAGNKGSANPIGQEPQAGDAVLDSNSSILSFKEIYLTIGELDFQADDGFLEAILSFTVSIPLADVWQDGAWREQQRRLLMAQFGPREVESLAMNAVLPLSAKQGQEQPLRWMQVLGA